MVPRDQYGNQIWVGDDMSGISAQLYSQWYWAPSPWEAVISFEPYRLDSGSPTARFRLTFNGVSQAGSYTLRVWVHGVRMSDVPTVYMRKSSFNSFEWELYSREAFNLFSEDLSRQRKCKGRPAS